MSSAVQDEAITIHTQWISGGLLVWAEGQSDHWGKDPSHHPRALADAPLRDALIGAGIDLTSSTQVEEVVMLLPGTPGPANTLRPLRADDSPPDQEELKPVSVTVPAIRFPPSRAMRVLDKLDELGASDGGVARPGPGVSYHALVGTLVRHLLSQQRVTPMVSQDARGSLWASWRPWLGDEATLMRVHAVLEAMPPIARAGKDEFSHEAWSILDDMLWRVVDAECRRALLREGMAETLDGRGADGPDVLWVKGLLGADPSCEASPGRKQELIRGVKSWVALLEDRGASAAWRLCLKLNEPIEALEMPDMTSPPPSMGWSLSFHLQAIDAPEVMIDAADVWLLPGEGISIEGRRMDQPHELLLAELARASRIFPSIERALLESEPVDIQLDTNKAYEFLREVRPAMVEQGFGVLAPAWWESTGSRLGTRLRIEADGPPGEFDLGGGATGAVTPQLGLSTLVDYHWEIAVGDTSLTLKEFEKLAASSSPLVRVGGKWIEVRPEDVNAAVKFIRENPGGKMQVGEALRLAFASDVRETGVPVLGLDAGGWIGELLTPGSGTEIIPLIEQPASFKGVLRPYQLRGLSWMAFLERFGFGVCLADDMGLGKTIQLLALLLSERENAAEGQPPNPTLLIAPTSVLGNWMHEARRFAPSLRTVIHHGVERKLGVEFAAEAHSVDLVITTYALAHRDREQMDLVNWERVVLDEAQFVKNPAAKQSQAARSLRAGKRIALTGTPVENRLSELWAIMEFLNPGYLGDATSFRKRFSMPIERYHDRRRSDQLKGLVRPFILRRLKTDPGVVSDLPKKLETKEYCHLTGEQAELYENCVKRMLGEVERAEGIHRRGLVLGALIRLKQICNHPSQLLKDHDLDSVRPPSVMRSGKSIRLMEQLDEVLAEGEQALIFTQFRQMGRLLQLMLRHEFDREILFLHGGTPQKQRQAIVDAFQLATGRNPILILSLKAGGVGLNLTAATHVFHYDRWWNPAVENQATDRAYRIGQTRTVVVHKYLVRGTLEERIDQMIEQKTELAENIIGAGERWLTELNTDDLKAILELRSDAIGDDA